METMFGFVFQLRGDMRLFGSLLGCLAALTVWVSAAGKRSHRS